MSIDNVLQLQNQLSVARSEIKNLRQQMVSMKHDYKKDCDAMISVLGEFRNSGSVAPDAPAPKVTAMLEKVTFQPIGVIESDFQTKRCVPRQPSVSQSRGCVRLDNHVLTNPEHALSGLEEYSHMWIIFHFHSTGSSRLTHAKVSPPRANNSSADGSAPKTQKFGVFATRSPHRPCPVGLSLVRIERVEENCIHFSGVDMVNGTPVLDLKPYIPEHDLPASPNPTQSLTDDRVGSPDASSRVDPPQNGHSNSDRSATGSSTALDLDISRVVLHSPVEIEEIEQFTNIEDTRMQGVGANTSASFTADPNDSVDGADTEMLQDSTTVPLMNDEISTSERGMPDGQERRSPPTPAPNIDSLLPPGNTVRVATWLANPSVPKVKVNFTAECLETLTQLMSGRSDAVKSEIVSVLQEDPRSSYVRIRYPGHPYHCAIAGVAVTCIFNDETRQCLVQTISSESTIQTM